jgi:hypothetical protein
MSYDTRHEPPVPPSPGFDPANGAAPPPKKKRSGSEKRRRGMMNKFRSTLEERAEMNANAAAVGLTFGAFMRALGCARPTTRVIRRRLPELLPFSQAFGKLGIHCSNAHQLLKLANRGEYPDMEEVRETHKKLNMIADEVLAIIRGYSGDYQR